MDPDFEEHYKELLSQWIKDEVSIKERLDEISKSLNELKEAIVNPTKKAGHNGIVYEDKICATALKGNIAGLLVRGNKQLTKFHFSNVKCVPLKKPQLREISSTKRLIPL